MMEQCLVISTIHYPDVPDNKASQIAEVVARINTYILMGHFNFYYNSRLVIHQTFLQLENVRLNDSLLDSYLGKSLRIHKTFHPIICKVIENDEEPILALLDFELNN